MPDGITKKCCDCKNILPTSLFYKDKSQRDGLQRRCKACGNIRSKQFREKHPLYSSHWCHSRYKAMSDTEKLEYNRSRYSKYRLEYIDQRKKYGSTVVGTANSLISSAIGRAKKKGIPFEIDRDWVLEQWEKQKGSCVLTNIVFDIEFKENNNHRYRPFSPSLDQIELEKGYTKENTRLVCTAINLALNSFGDDVLELVCKSYLDTLNKRRQNA